MSDTIGAMNQVMEELRKQDPLPILTPEEKAKQDAALLADLAQAEWMIGPQAAETTDVICSVCEKHSPLRNETPYPFRAKAGGGSFDVYIAGRDAEFAHLCPECCVAIWDFLTKRRNELA